MTNTNNAIDATTTANTDTADLMTNAEWTELFGAVGDAVGPVSASKKGIAILAALAKREIGKRLIIEAEGDLLGVLDELSPEASAAIKKFKEDFGDSLAIGR